MVPAGWLAGFGRQDERGGKRQERQEQQRDRPPGEPAAAAWGGGEIDHEGRNRQHDLP